MAGFQINFQDHRQLSETTSRCQVTLGNPEQASWRVLLERSSKLVKFLGPSKIKIIFIS
jgi:hypothetical protein